MKSNHKTWLWKVQHSMMNQPSYVFGTMHVQDASAFTWWSEVTDAIEQCPVFAAEYPLDASQDPSKAHLSLLPAGQTIRDFLSPNHFKKLSTVFTRMTGQPVELYIRLRPLFLTQILTEQILAKDFPESLDQSLWNQAKQSEKELIGIESLDEQIEILDSIPYWYQIRALMGIVTNRKRFRQHLLQSTQLYQAGEVQRLFQSVKRGTGHMRKLMIYKRNIIMADRIAMYSLRRPLVAAIGAGHLGGAKGVLRLLKQKGFKITAV